MKIVFLGTSSTYAWLPLNSITREHEIVGIIESAARGSQVKQLGFWLKMQEGLYALLGQPSLWFYAWRKKLPYFFLTRTNTDDLPPFIERLGPDIGVVASFNQLLPEEVIGIPIHGMINIHPSLLPAYRGPCVWFWYYHQMEKVGGVTIHFLDRGEDTGDILIQESFPIPVGILPGALQKTAINLGVRLLLESLRAISNGNAHLESQPNMPATLRARRLRPGEDLFDWQKWSLEHTFHFLRGTYPWYRALNVRHGLMGFLYWRAFHYEGGAGKPPYGKISLDGHGFYFSHPDGKVRLRLARQSVQVIFILLIIMGVLIRNYLG